MKPNYRSQTGNRRRTAFSLVELMVVIGIISLLIGIALPAFSAAKTSARKATTQGAITAISTGLETLRADDKFGGQYPPSYSLENNWVESPYVPGTKLPAVCGANLVAWATVGADLQGTPGFRDLNRTDQPGLFNGYAPWADDVGALYSMNGSQPNYPRTSFVDPSKMKFPQRDKDGATFLNTFTIPSQRKQQVTSICFLDSFDQPILYYRASQGRANMVANALERFNTGPAGGAYNMRDNAQMYLDYGGGDGHFSTGLWGGDANKFPDPQIQAAYANSFAHMVWNPAAASVPTPHNAEGYILLSAGPDGRYGTPDDLGNFQINK